HRMLACDAQLVDDARALGTRRGAGEGDAFLHDVTLAAEAPQEIEMPPGAAKLAVGDRFEAELFLFLDDALDLAVLDRLETRGVERALAERGARLFQRGGAQQAADVVGAERRLGAWHRCLLFFVGGTIAFRRAARL